LVGGCGGGAAAAAHSSTLGRLKTRKWKTRNGRKVTVENQKPTRITEFNV